MYDWYLKCYIWNWGFLIVIVNNFFVKIKDLWIFYNFDMIRIFYDYSFVSYNE